eukprot:scaffold7780_cov267-Pinguiococcus_pyrenoidosus.AAC.5
MHQSWSSVAVIGSLLKHRGQRDPPTLGSLDLRRKPPFCDSSARSSQSFDDVSLCIASADLPFRRRQVQCCGGNGIGNEKADRRCFRRLCLDATHPTWATQVPSTSSVHSSCPKRAAWSLQVQELEAFRSGCAALLQHAEAPGSSAHASNAPYAMALESLSSHALVVLCIVVKERGGERKRCGARERDGAGFFRLGLFHATRDTKYATPKSKARHRSSTDI